MEIRGDGYERTPRNKFTSGMGSGSLTLERVVDTVLV